MEPREITENIIGAAMEVHRALGAGFLESIYRNALARELSLRGLSVEIEREVVVTYKDFVVGRHRLDLVVEGAVIVELKAASAILAIHTAQALSYIRATGIPLSLVVNFGESSLTWKRLIKTRIESA
jgi:GxxExxY protein